jgi:hypothetical protein
MPKIKVDLKKDGTVTLSGIKWEDLKNLFTQACLYSNDSLKDAKERYTIVERGENLPEEEMSESLRKELHDVRVRNAEWDVSYCENMLALAHLMGELLKEAGQRAGQKRRAVAESKEDRFYVREEKDGTISAYRVPYNTYPLSSDTYHRMLSSGALGVYPSLEEVQKAHPDLNLPDDLRTVNRTFGNCGHYF